MLWEQDKDDDDGLEQYVRRAIDAKEILWFPLRKAMRLEQKAGPSDILRTDLKESVKITEHLLSDKFDEFHIDVNVMMEQLLVSLKNETAPVEVAEVLAEGASEVEDDAFEDASLASENSYTKNILLGYHVSLGVASLEGVQMDEFELRTISCRLIFQTGMTVFKNVGAEGGVVLFDEYKQVPIFDNVQPADRRMFQIQVLHGLGAQKFLAVLDLSVLELLSAEGEMSFIIDKKFTLPSQSGICTLNISIASEAAKTFGRKPSVKLMGSRSSEGTSPGSPMLGGMGTPGSRAASFKGDINPLRQGSFKEGMTASRQASFKGGESSGI
ncbi:hypothetical protein B484DRAFT_408300 [Ochromonadaceae sp. CCMP2298]|nr:hypothetical protein B484DRAFT_408300 [Ochromonadaceae sp. CCMP2298]